MGAGVTDDIGGIDHGNGIGQNPVKAPLCGSFGHRNSRKEPCGSFVIRGTTACKRHAGRTLAEHKARGELSLMMRGFGLGDAGVDPKEFALQLVAQSKARVEMLSEALGRAYDAAERLRDAHLAQRLVEIKGESDEEATAAELVARADLERIFNVGGVAALVGHTYTATQAGGIYATGEAIRGLQKLEAEERDRAATFAFKAVAAGIAQQQVDAYKRMGEQMAAVLRAAFAQLQLSPDQLLMVPSVLASVTAQLELTA
jgi:hypothetical protein